MASRISHYSALSLLLSFALTIACAAPASALSTRAWVSGHGTDAAGCGAPNSPCRSLQYVVSNIIAAGGEIDVLDPAGYGAVTIPFALSIVNDGAGVAGVQQASSGQNAITIAAGASDAVVLRGLTIDGLGVAQNGVLLNGAEKLTIDNCVIRHFVGSGVYLSPTANGVASFLIAHTIIANNANGVSVIQQGSGFGPVLSGAIDHDTIYNNASIGVLVQGGGAQTVARAELVETVVAGNATGVEVAATDQNSADKAYTAIMVRDSASNYNSGAGYSVSGVNASSTSPVPSQRETPKASMSGPMAWRRVTATTTCAAMDRRSSER